MSTCSSPSWAWGPPAEAPALSAPPLFHVVIGFRAEEGLYTLSFHNCYNLMPGGEQPFNITVMIQEKNPEGFLSAVEMPFFKLYMVMSTCFLAADIYWVSVLCKNTYTVFRIHWLMAALVLTKSISLLLHSAEGRPPPPQHRLDRL